MNPQAGKPVRTEDLIDIKELIKEYYEQKPNAAEEAQKVVFGTSGHRGSSLKSSFNETHILAISQALCDYRKDNNITGTLL
jgi:phosphoglucomutase